MAIRSKKSHASRLMIETLEGREVPAASIVVGAVSGGVLTLTGDDLTNEIVLQDTGTGMTVTGLNANTTVALAATPTVGAASQTFPLVDSIKFVLKGGDDAVTLDDTVAFNLSGAVTADMGDGDNTLDLSDGTVNAIVASLDYKGLGGNDVVSFGDGTVMTVATVGKVTVNAGDGFNSLNIQNAAVAGDISFTAAEGGDQVSLIGVTAAKNVTVNTGTGDAFNSLALSGATITGNLSFKGSGGFHFLQAFGATASAVNGSAGVTVDAGTNGASFLAVSTALTIPNGGLTLTGKNSQSSINNSAALTVGKNLTISNDNVFANTAALTVGGVSATGVNNASFNVNGVATVNGAVAVKSTTGDASASFNGASAALMKAVSVTGVTGATLRDNVAAAGVSHFFSTVSVSASHGDAEFRQNGNSALTVDGAVTAKGYYGSDVFFQGSSAKTLAKDVTSSSAVGTGKLEASGGKTTFSGNVSVKGYYTDVTLNSTAAGSTIAKNLSITGGPGDDSLTWAGGLNVLGNAMLNYGSGGAAALNFGGGATATEVKNLTVSTGAAVDTLTFNNFKANGTSAIKTGASADRVSIDNSTFTGTFALDTGDADDTLSIAQNNTDLPTTFTGKATIKLGAGNDTLNLGTPGADLDKALFAAAGSTIDGGLGSDTSIIATNQPADTDLTLTGFEVTV